MKLVQKSSNKLVNLPRLKVLILKNNTKKPKSSQQAGSGFALVPGGCVDESVMSEEEDKRAKQLEEARKRVEELKKRNKKDKKKKKQIKEVEKTEESKASSQEPASEVANESEAPEVEEPIEVSKEEVPKSQVEQDQDTAEQINTSKSPSNDTSQLFSDENEKGSDFMTTIQKQSEEEEIKKLKADLDLKASECKTLKFVNMEQESTIEELQAEVKRLQDELQATTDKLRDTEIRLNAAEQAAASADAARLQFSQFNTHESIPPGNEDSMHRDPLIHKVNIDRAALDRWRHWNVDMTSWRSIGAGPVVEF